MVPFFSGSADFVEHQITASRRDQGTVHLRYSTRRFSCGYNPAQPPCRLAPMAGKPKAAEGRNRRDGAIGIDPDDTGPDRLLMRWPRARFLGKDAGGKAKTGVVREPDRLLLRLEGYDGENRTEEFLLQRGGRDTIAIQNRWMVEIAWTLRTISTGHQSLPQSRPRPARADRHDPAAACSEWPDFGCHIQRAADADRLRLYFQPCQKFILYRTLDDQPRARDTGLAGGGKDASHLGVDGALYIRIGEHHEGDLPPSSSEVDARFLRNCAPRDAPIPTTGKGDMRDIRMACQCGAAGCAKTGDDVDDAWRKARLMYQPRKTRATVGTIFEAFRTRVHPAASAGRSLPQTGRAGCSRARPWQPRRPARAGARHPCPACRWQKDPSILSAMPHNSDSNWRHRHLRGGFADDLTRVAGSSSARREALAAMRSVSLYSNCPRWLAVIFAKGLRRAHSVRPSRHDRQWLRVLPASAPRLRRSRGQGFQTSLAVLELSVHVELEAPHEPYPSKPA